MSIAWCQLGEAFGFCLCNCPTPPRRTCWLEHTILGAAVEIANGYNPMVITSKSWDIYIYMMSIQRTLITVEHIFVTRRWKPSGKNQKIQSDRTNHTYFWQVSNETEKWYKMQNWEGVFFGPCLMTVRISGQSRLESKNKPIHLKIEDPRYPKTS